MLSPSTDPTDTRLEIATKKGEYGYWLTYEDIADIARLQYSDYGTSDTADSYKAFEIIGSPAHLRNKLQSFITKANQIEYVRLSFIINIEQLHWVTLVVVSHQKNVSVFYIDSLRQELSASYLATLAENNLHLAAINLNGYFRGQEDDYNCGLWALENAQDLKLMTDEQKGLMWISQRLQRPRSLNYFTRLRVLLSLKLSEDPVRKARIVPLEYQLSPHGQPVVSVSNSDLAESKSKKQKLLTEAEKTRELYEFFVKKFLQDFVKRLGIHAVIAKGERLTPEALKTELRVGTTGALFGLTIAQNIAGSIPSLVASLRIISSKYYVNKKVSQKITKIFSELKTGELSGFLTEAAIEIFQSYEQQFMQITDKAGHKIAIEKLAEDAAGRVLNYIDEKVTSATPISSELIGFGILFGKSETFFDPSLKKVRVRVTGSRIQDAEGNSFSTSSLYERVGLVVKVKDTSPDKFYKKDAPQSTRYGYRRLLSWEKDSEGQLKEIYQANYIPEIPAGLTPYAYQLNADAQQEKMQLLRQLNTESNLSLSRQATSPKNIFFNLRRPIKNFSGRTLALTTLHQLLGSEIKSAVVTQKMARLSLNQEQGLQEGIQTAVSGMGGIGKTQLVLEYAKQYAAQYDHNVLWIEAEKKIDILDSFKKLARKLTIDLNDVYNNEKESSQLIEDVYSFFKNAKSLFIFDNVENVKEIEDILPKVSSGNHPTVLITSRYSNWKNVAIPLTLDVFTEIEAIGFIKTELFLMDNAEDSKIKELTRLLQNLPLALQQAIAYIKNEKNLDSAFTIQHYIDRFKQKSQELLDFEFSNYSNDPYSKTVLTTWEITLEKLAQEKLIGVKAIETLQMMAYLYPDNISNQFFITLKNNQYLSAAIQLLKNYSLINEGSESHISTIHRLVQKVLRINLEKNQSEFATIVQAIKFLTKDFVYDKEIMSHYYSFLLHMMQHEDLAQALHLQATHKKILEVMVHYDGDKTLLFNLFDAAQLTLPRVQYLNFIGEALIIFMRCPFIISLTNVIEYIEKNVNEGHFSLTEARQIIDLQYTPLAAKIYKFGRFSPDPATNARQRTAANLVLMLDSRLFSKESGIICRRSKKRSVNTLCSVAEEEGLLQDPLKSAKIKSYAKKIGRVANLANLGILTKDTLSALIQGDFESVAISFTLLISSRIFGKISNKLLTKGGELLALADEELFQKEIDYDAKLALSIFTDKEIMLAGKRRLLGKVMQAARPYVARLGTLYFGYKFIKGLSDNETDWVDNLSNGAIVAFDFGEAGIESAEYLGYIAGVSEVTGPIGEGLGALVIGGVQLYHVKQEQKAIEKWVHLSEREKFAEGMRTFFNFQPSEYLEAKANNEQLANKAIDFLKLHPEIYRYVFSAWLPATDSAKKNFVFLDRKRNLTILDTVPEKPNEGHFFCLMGVRARPHSTSWLEEHLESFVESELLGLEEGIFYLCINTLGVEYNANRNANTTLIALQGNATVLGAHTDSILLINDGHQDYRAGDADDLFILQGTRITGRLQGGLGVNIVKFSEYQPAANQSVLLDSQGFLCGKNVTTNGIEEFCVGGLQLSNITQLHGRKKQQDKIFPIANTTLVDTHAGENAEKPDFIYITEKSAKNLNITLRPNTIVRLLPRNITADNLVVYNIPWDQNGTASLQLPFNDEASHQFHFTSNFEDLNELSIKNHTISFRFNYPEASFQLNIEATDTTNSNVSTIEKAFFIQSASYIFNKKLEMKLLNEKTLFAKWNGNNSAEEIIYVVAPVAHDIDKAMIIQTTENATIAIGGRQHEILSTDGLLTNHLVGNAGDAVYVIQAPKNITDLFPLNDISLYNLANDTLISSTATDTLDLSELLKQAQEQCNTSGILPIVNERNKDLILSLYANYYFSASGCILLAQNTYRIAQIILKNALSNYWYQDLDIILDDHQHPMGIIFEEDKWELVRTPLVFMGNKNIIVITDDIVKHKDELFILKNMGQYRFMRHNDTDLLITNLFNNATEAELYTFVFSNFFKHVSFQEKTLSLSLSFFDESLTLNEHTQEINNATDFFGEIHSHFNTPHIVFNESGIFFNNATSSIKRRRRDIEIPLSISSGSSSIMPGVYDAFISLRLKILQYVSFILKGFKFNSDFSSINAKGEKFTSRKIKYSAEFPKKATTNPPVYCNQKNFFIEEECVKNQSGLGLLGYCANTQQVLVWFKKNTTEAAPASTLSWFAIAYQGVSINHGNHSLNASDIRLSLQTDHLHFSNKDGCYQVLNLNNVSNTSLVTLFPYLPEEGKQWLLTQWRHEKKIHDQTLQDETAVGLFKQQIAQIGLNYIGNTGLLHTFVGDYFRAIGLRPNWQEHDPSHFLARWLSAIQQLRLGAPNQTSTVAAALLETALLHPLIQQSCSLFLPNTKIRYKKQALRFCADLIQWGSLNFALLPSLLEILFSDYLPIASITWGLRVALSFYMINNDPSYYYLGMALFFLPQLPSLLEHLGIPVTACISTALERLSQLFIFQSLLEFKPTPDETRIAQRKFELQLAEQRVVRGIIRMSAIVKPLRFFFKPVPKPSFNQQQEDQPSAQYAAA